MKTERGRCAVAFLKAAVAHARVARRTVSNVAGYIRDAGGMPILGFPS
jgi:hypothetical protein